METSYKTLREESKASYIEKKSEFIGEAKEIFSEEEALLFIEQRRKRYHDARHHVYAYRLKSGLERYSDDGEPQGTAGMPILDVLKREELTNAVCVVTRYFGGTLLGAGPLCRAYIKAAKLAIDESGVKHYRLFSVLTGEISYDKLPKLQNLLPKYEAKIIESSYGEKVFLKIRLPLSLCQEFLKEITETFAATITFEVCEETFGCD